MSKVCLVVIDGYGISHEPNSPTEEATFLNSLKESCLYYELNAHGKHVGLPAHSMGNSEAGHMTIGAGRVVPQGIDMINGNIENNQLQLRIASLLPSMSGRIHLVGLLSNGGVHSSMEHCKALMSVISSLDCSKAVFVHAIADGRDTSPKIFRRFFDQFDNIVSVAGRHYTMDRDHNHDRIDMAFNMMTRGCVEELDWDTIYKDGTTDEFIRPVLIKDECIHPSDTIIFFNTRADRMVQIVERFSKVNKSIYTLTDYKPGLGEALFPNAEVKNTLSEVISKHGKTQVHLAETEKFAHVTYFFNGLSSKTFPRQSNVVIPSKKVKSFDQFPSCSMPEVCEKAIESIRQQADFVLVNLAGPDMVGHTGNHEAVLKAIKTADGVIKKLFDFCMEHDYVIVATADHGNCEKMFEQDDVCKTHTTNKVPLIISSDKHQRLERDGMGLSDVAPTILKIMEIDQPPEMSGHPLVKKK